MPTMPWFIFPSCYSVNFMLACDAGGVARHNFFQPLLIPGSAKNTTALFYGGSVSLVYVWVPQQHITVTGQYSTVNTAVSSSVCTVMVHFC